VVRNSSKATLTAAAPQLFVADIEQSCDFFTQKLGFSLVFVHGQPPFYAQVKRDAAVLNLRSVDSPVMDPARTARESLLSVSLTVAMTGEIAHLFAEFQAASVVFHQELQDEPWSAKDFIVKDLDGNLLLFAGPID
jgi:catechol 2,3-dioxygenase-like lactoylglutathione lyase family enzyme